MSYGFFQAGTFAKAPAANVNATVPYCGACGLWRNCRSPKMPWSGEGLRGILVVGEAPGKTEDDQGSQFVGKTGNRLRDEFAALGVDLDRDCWKTNSLICWPGPGADGKGNANPTKEQVNFCRPNLFNTIQELQPTTVILLGNPAVESLIGRLWRPDPGPISRWAGWRIPDQTINAWVCPTWHPSFIVREEEKNPAQLLWWRRHLAAAVALESRPWPDGPPDYAAQVEIIYNADEAANALDWFIEQGFPVAPDFETTTLKPDGPHTAIYTCAVSNGDRTISYPWHGAAIVATQRLLRSPVPKICYHAKFEWRFTKAEFGHGINNIVWCGMNAAHVLDNRMSVTGLKFQSYVRLGQPQYNDAVEDYLKADGTNAPNRIRQVDLGQLLKYGGMDALLEVLIARHQMEEMGVTPWCCNYA